LARCPAAATLCGTVRWLWEAVDEKGRPRLDTQNPEASLRSRPLVGVSILSGLTLAPGGGWSGRIYNPEDGQTYRATLRPTATDALLVKGCVLFVCRKQTWRRANALVEALARSSP
ncbi:MAG TPA: DUF2147 domain-containing protein, partial [Reyranella sp.]|nr:DUF2147 domain-containing protein [Reyranella sp.]